MANPVIELDNIVCLVRVYFSGNITASQQARIKARILHQIYEYDERHGVNFDIDASTSELLKTL